MAIVEKSGFMGNIVFVPFLGDFLSIWCTSMLKREPVQEVFVPFLGDFLSISQLR